MQKRRNLNLNNADAKLWAYVGIALVVGLLIPDNMNPVKMLIDKFKKEGVKKVVIDEA